MNLHEGHRRVNGVRPHGKPKGEIKPHWLTEWHSSSMRLIDYLAENFPEMSSVNHCDTTQVRLYRLLCDPDEAYTDEMWHEKIRHYMSVLKDCYRKNSDTAMCLAVKAKEGNKLVSMPTKSKGRNLLFGDSPQES